MSKNRLITNVFFTPQNNTFHPYDIFVAIGMATLLKSNYLVHTPHKNASVTELLSYVLYHRRNYFSVFFNPDNSLRGSLNFKNGIIGIELYLRQQYPEITHYIDTFKKEDLEKMIAPSEEVDILKQTIEEKFGKAVAIKPMIRNQEDKCDYESTKCNL